MADFVAGYFGARGRGKTTLVRAELARLNPRRLLIFDPMRQFSAEAEAVPSLAVMLERVRSGRAWRLRYEADVGAPDPVMRARFDAFCSIAYSAGDLALVADELQLATQPSRPAPWWRKCILLGRHEGVQILATSQRPALVDINLRGNFTRLYSFCLVEPEDARRLAPVLGVDRAALLALPLYHYIGRDLGSGGAPYNEKTSPPRARGPRR